MDDVIPKSIGRLSAKNSKLFLVYAIRENVRLEERSTMFLKPRKSPFFPECKEKLSRETIWHSLRGKIKARYRSSEPLEIDRAEGSYATKHPAISLVQTAN